MRIFTLLLIALAPLRAQELLVAAAADLSPLAPKLREAFQKSTGIQMRFALGSSGQLAQQIASGAPFDVFLSANEKYIDDLKGGGRLDSSTITVYAIGRIAVWSAEGLAKSLEDLKKPVIKHVAIANPEHAPYGMAAKQALEKLGLWKEIEPKLVYGENVTEAYQFAESRNADAVITSWTLLLGRGTLVPSNLHAPIRQVGAVVRASTHPQDAQKFLQFLTNPEARRIFESSGLELPDSR